MNNEQSAVYYEAHVTVEQGHSQIASDVAKKTGAKFVHIELPRGAVPSQPMLTLLDTSYDAVMNKARAAARELETAGAKVNRVKIECQLHAPECNAYASTSESDPLRYYESHVKVDISSDEFAAVSAIAAQHDAHTSRNARRVLENGRQQRFLTVRTAKRADLIARVDALEAALRESNVTVMLRQDEHALYDSARSLDRGWCDPATPAAN